MKKLIYSGGEIWAREIDSISEKLAPGNYLLKLHPKEGFYLQEKEEFRIPKKIYGDMSVVQRWIKSYNNSTKNMGILLRGMKGSGKTLLAQEFCRKSGMPVIFITQPFMGPEFVDYITQPLFNNSIIFIDEFEKVYDRIEGEYGQIVDAQKELLGIMDGNFSTRLVFLMTCNESDSLSEYLNNRLSRIKYAKDFTDLDQSVSDAIIDDMLDNKSYREEIYEVLKKLGAVTMDILIPLIEECNLHKESPKECAKHLNLKAETRYYEITERIDGNELPCDYAYFSLDKVKQDIRRDWVNLSKYSKLANNYVSCARINLNKDTVKIISSTETHITTQAGEHFILKASRAKAGLVF